MNFSELITCFDSLVFPEEELEKDDVLQIGGSMVKTLWSIFGLVNMATGAAPPAIPKQLESNTELQNVTQYSDGIKLLTKEGLDTSILAVLRDGRFISFDDSLLSSIESSLCKAMISAFSTQHKYQSKRYETLLLQTDLSKANTVIPKPIQWKDVNLPEEWILEGAAPPAIPKQLEPNTELQNVTQYSDGKVKLSFRRSTSSRFSDKASCSSIPSLERKFTKIPYVINLHFQSIKSQPRFSTSDIPSTSIRSVDYTTSVPHPIYTSNQHVQSQEEKEPSPPTSPTKKVSEWKLLDSDRTIESEHPPLRSVTVDHGEPLVQIRASPYKIPKPNDSEANLTSSDIEAFKEEPSTPKANKIHWELTLPTVKTPPDLAIDNRPSTLNQSRYNASSVYEWNIDGMSEYNILGLLQQMTMAANAYKTQAGTSDRAISEILIVGFTGQLKGWWDHILTNQQQLDILNSIQVDENEVPILDEFNNPIQDAVATLILTISLHFIGDPLHLRDKNAELLHNLRCRKLSEF
ncbi:hypothetical protein KPL70_024027 [Citrus sinensis]|nr:hypothetical protein KPL70_024027 [Citrus sinensis]